MVILNFGENAYYSVIGWVAHLSVAGVFICRHTVDKFVFYDRLLELNFAHLVDDILSELIALVACREIKTGCAVHLDAIGNRIAVNSEIYV